MARRFSHAAAVVVLSVCGLLLVGGSVHTVGAVSVSAETTASASLQALAERVLHGEQPLQNAEDQLVGIHARLASELGALKAERGRTEALCSKQMLAAQTKLVATRGRLQAAVGAATPKAKAAPAALIEAMSSGLVDNRTPRHQKRSAPATAAALRRAIATDRSVLGRPAAAAPLAPATVLALRKVFRTQTTLLMDTTKECALQTSLYRRLVAKLEVNQKTAGDMLALLRSKKGKVEAVLAEALRQARVPAHVAGADEAARAALVANGGCRAKCAAYDAERPTVCAKCRDGRPPVSAHVLKALRDSSAQGLRQVQNRMADLAATIAKTRALPAGHGLHAASLRRVVATHHASVAHVKAQHESALAKIRAAVARAYMGPKGGSLNDVMVAARQGAVELVHATHQEALAKIHLAHEASLNRIHARHVTAMDKAHKAAVACGARADPAEDAPCATAKAAAAAYNRGDHAARVLDQHKAAVARVADQHMKVLEAIRKERADAHHAVLAKHAQTMEEVRAQHAEAIEKLSAREVTAMEAEEQAAAVGAAHGQAPFPVLFPGQLRTSGGGKHGHQQAIYVPAANLQVAAQSDFYRCKFMDVVVDAVMVRGRNPATGKKGQYLKCTPPPPAAVANATAVVVQASVDAGETFFGQGVVYAYPAPTDVPEDDPSSFESILRLRQSAKAWQAACDKAVAKAKAAQAPGLERTEETERRRALAASNARVACQRFTDATTDANEASIAMHARIKAERSGQLAQNASAEQKRINATAVALRVQGTALVAAGLRAKNAALAKLRAAEAALKNATAAALAAEDKAREFLEVRRKAVAERRAVDRQLAERESAVASADNIVDQLTVQAKGERKHTAAQETALIDLDALVEPSQAAAAGVEATATLRRLNDSAVVLAKGKASLDALRARRAEANATAVMALQEVAAAKVQADEARADGHAAAQGVAAATKALRNATAAVARGNKVLEEAERLAAEALRLKRVAEAAVSDVHYEGLVSTRAARKERSSERNGMRINPEILRGDEARPANEIVDLMKEEPGTVVPGGRRVGPALHDADLGVGEFPKDEPEDDEDATGATGETGATGATATTGGTGTTGATGSSMTGLPGAASTGAAATGPGADFAAALAVAYRNKRTNEAAAFRNRVYKVKDETLLGLTDRRHLKQPPTAAQVAASLRKGCDFHFTGMLWCEGAGRCYEPATEDSACNDKPGTLPAATSAASPADVLDASSPTGGALDASKEDIVDGVVGVEKEGERAEKAEAADKEKAETRKQEAAAAALAVTKAKREGGDVAAAEKALGDATEAVAETEANIMKSKHTVEKAEAVLKGALKGEETRLVKEEQQEAEAKQALQERARAAAEKNTPGAVSDMEQQKDEVADIKATEKEEREKMDRTKEALTALKARNGDRQAEEKAMEATKPLLDGDNEKHTPEMVTAAERYPRRLRTPVTVTLQGYNDASFDDEQKLQVRTVVAEIADVDVQQVSIVSVVDPVATKAAAADAEKARDAEEDASAKEEARHDDAIDAFVEVVNATKKAIVNGLVVELSIAAPSVAVAAGFAEKFQKATANPEDLLAMFQGSGLNNTQAVVVDERTPRAASAPGATGATGAMNEDPSSTGMANADRKADAVDRGLADENHKRNEALLTGESRRLAAIISKQEALLKPLLDRLHRAQRAGDNATASKISTEVRKARKVLVDARKQDNVVQAAAVQELVVTPEVHAAVAAQDKFLKARCKSNCDKGTVGADGTVDYEKLSKSTQAIVARVAKENYERAVKGLGPLPVPAEKVKVPKIIAPNARGHGEINAEAGILASDTPLTKARKHRDAVERHVASARLHLDNATAREEAAKTRFGGLRKALAGAMKEAHDAKADVQQKELDVANGCGGANNVADFKVVKAECAQALATAVERAAKANATLSTAAKRQFAEGAVAWQAAMKGVKLTKAVLRQAEAHLDLANVRVAIQEDEEVVRAKRANVTALEQALRGATHLLKVGGDSEDKSLTANAEEARAQLATAKAVVANATTRLDDSKLAERSAGTQFAMAQEGEKAVRAKAEETLRLYVSESRATLALEKVEEAEKLKLAMDDEAKAEAEAEATAPTGAATGAAEEEDAMTAGTGSTGASGATGAMAIEVLKVAARAKKKAAMVAAERNVSVVAETLAGHSIDATGAALHKKVSEELKKQRLAKAAKAAQLAAEAIDGPRADDSKSDDELHALKDAENRTAQIIEKVERTTVGNATAAGNGTVRTATGVASAADAQQQPRPAARPLPRGTGATGVAGATGGSTGAAASAITSKVFALGQALKGSTGATGAFASAETGAATGAAAADLRGAIASRKAAEGQVNGLERELAQLRRSVAAAQLALAQKSSESANALTDPAVQNAEIRLTAAKAAAQTMVDRVAVARAYVEESKARVVEGAALVRASGMESTVKGLEDPDAGEGKVVELPKVAVRNPRDAPETAALKTALVKALTAVPAKKAAHAQAETAAVEAGTACKYAEREADAKESAMEAAVKEMSGASPSVEDAAKASRLQVEQNASRTEANRRCTKATELARRANETAVAHEDAQEGAKEAKLRLDAFLAAKRQSFLTGEGPLPRRFMKQPEFEKEREGIRGGNPNVRYSTPLGSTDLGIIAAMGVETKYQIPTQHPIWFVPGSRSFAETSAACQAETRDVHVCSVEEVEKAVSGGYRNEDFGFTSTVPLKNSKAPYGAAAGFNVVVAGDTVKYANWLAKAGAYCCATLTKDRRFRTLSLRPGLVPVTYPDGKIKIVKRSEAHGGDFNVSKAIHVESSSDSLATILRKSAEKVRPVKVAAPVKVTKADDRDEVDRIRAIVAKSKQNRLDFMKNISLGTGATGVATADAMTGGSRPVLPTGGTGAADKGPADGGLKQEPEKGPTGGRGMGPREGVEEEPTGAAQPVEETGDAFTGGAATGGAGSRKAKRGTF